MPVRNTPPSAPAPTSSGRSAKEIRRKPQVSAKRPGVVEKTTTPSPVLPPLPPLPHSFGGYHTTRKVMDMIDNRRKEMGIKVTDFCKEVGIDKSNYYKLMKESEPGLTFATLFRFMEPLNMGVNFTFGSKP